MIQLRELIENRTVDLYDGNFELAQGVRSAGSQQVTLFAKGATNASKDGISIRSYHSLRETADCAAGVCMLNNRSIKVLVAMYPSAPKYVLIRLAPRVSWLLGFVGLLRRLLVGLVRIKGIGTLQDSQNKRTYWLVLEQTGRASRSIPMLPKSVGVPAFLTWLKEEKINYVVLRFYERLPELYREGGDIDLLIVAEDKPKVEAYLKKHAHLLTEQTSDIRLGLHSVSGEQGTIPYYPPPIARQILSRSIDGPANSRIPLPKDAFLSFIYHVLYHSKKGYVAGIPSKHNEHTEQYPENDYLGVILAMAKKLEVDFADSITMEELDEYMAVEGWRPKIDTLAKIGETNAWVRDRFFSGDQGGPAGLSVFMVRQWAYDQGITDEVLRIIEGEGFTILRKKVLSEEERQRASEQLRGGTWGEDEDGNTEKWRPAVAIVVVDQRCVNMPPAYAGGFERFRIRNLKEKLRITFDADGRGSVHSTDNTRESWEYIDVCFPGEIDTIKSEVVECAQSSWLSRISGFLSLTYLRHSARHSLREWFIRTFLE